MKVIRETYKAGTKIPKLLYSEEIDVPDPVPTMEDRVVALEAEVVKLKKP